MNPRRRAAPAQLSWSLRVQAVNKSAGERSQVDPVLEGSHGLERRLWMVFNELDQVLGVDVGEVSELIIPVTLGSDRGQTGRRRV